MVMDSRQDEESPREETEDEDLLSELKRFVSEEDEELVRYLKNLVEIPSISTGLQEREACMEVGEMLRDLVTALGGNGSLVPVGYQQISSERKHELSKAFLAQYGNSDPQKATVLVYGHYDVLPADQTMNWKTDPFKLVEKDRKFYGRGTASMKGIFLPWLFTAKAYEWMDRELPVNLKFLIEGMGESNSECMEELLKHEAGPGGFLSNIDCLCIPQPFSVGGKRPSLPLTTMGLLTIEIEVLGMQSGLDADKFSCFVIEPAIDLARLVASLYDSDYCLSSDIDLKGARVDTTIGRTGSTRDASQGRRRAQAEKEIAELKDQAGVSHLKFENDPEEYLREKESGLTVTIHHMETNSGYAVPVKIVPNTANARLSVRAPVGWDMDLVAKAIQTHLENTFQTHHSPNTLKIDIEVTDSVVLDPDSVAYQAAKSTLEMVSGNKPEMPDVCGPVKILPACVEYLDTDAVVLAMGTPGNNIGIENENILRRTFLDGTLIASLLLHNIAKQFKDEGQVPKGSDQSNRDGLLRRLSRLWKGLG